MRWWGNDRSESSHSPAERIGELLDAFWADYDSVEGPALCRKILTDLEAEAPGALAKGEPAGWAAGVIYDVVLFNASHPEFERLLIVPETIMFVLGVSLEDCRSYGERISNALRTGSGSKRYAVSGLRPGAPPRLRRGSGRKKR